MFTWIVFLLLTLIIGIINVTINLSKNLSRSLNYILAIVTFCLFGFNRLNNDYQAYVFYFENSPNFVEKGYLYLIKLIKYFEGNHNWIILLTAFLLITFFFIKNENKYTGIILFLYGLNYFMFDITQLRNTLLLVFISYGVYYCSKEKILLYYFFNILGILIQNLGITYLGFGLLQNLDKKKYLRIIFLLFCFNLITINIIKVLIIKYFPGKAQIYFSYKPSIFGILTWYFLIFLDLLSFKLLEVNKYENKLFNQMIYKFYLYNLIFLPLTMLNVEIFARLYRNLFLLKCLLITNQLLFIKVKKIKVIFILFLGTLLPVIILLFRDFEFYKQMITYFNIIEF